MYSPVSFFLFFFNDTQPTEIYTLSLHDALPISDADADRAGTAAFALRVPHRVEDALLHALERAVRAAEMRQRSEEHTSELQSHSDLVCRLLLEKKKISEPGDAYFHSPNRIHRNC